MTIDYKAADRKPLVQAVSDYTGVKARYLKTPSCAYQIGDFTVTKEGNLTFNDSTDADGLIHFLAEKGFTAESIPEEQEEPQGAEEPLETAAFNTGLVISFSADKVNLENLKKLLESKSALIKKALEVEAFPIEERDNQVSFPWWPSMPNFEAITAYTNFLAALCKKSVERKRITAKAREVENEKYAFRCFLLSLGFIGEDYKKARSILLRNFSGSSAFKSGARKNK